MKLKSMILIIVTLVLAGLLTGCGGAAEETTVATLIPAATTTALTEVVEGPTETITLTLHESLEKGLEMALETDALLEEKVGGGMISAELNGVDYEDVDTVFQACVEIFENQGWQEDTQNQGAGPAALLTGFRKDDELCMLAVSGKPVDEALCSQDEPFGNCWSSLAPEQRVFEVAIECLLDFDTSDVKLTEPEAVRIQFEAGEVSGIVNGNLLPNSIGRYVLTAGEGQEMFVTLSTSIESEIPNAILVIWGADGTVLISDHADATAWYGELPLTQDYFIDVRTNAEESLDYTLTVTIPPVSTSEILPLDVPVGFEFTIGLGSTGVPVMLPPDFPVSADLPAVQPFVLTAEPGEYEISLDFGPECQGAGACHYGSLTGKQVVGDMPVDTRSYAFEADRAQVVMLERNIKGFFVEAQCGANCDDAKVYWIYNGFQYMVGLKGGAYADVVALANAMIENSTGWD